ncbi:putative regulatory protein, FmdB family [Alkalispirochaeta americana]|uniref:Putative regulatory protein, FmdB family n=1 Tax=Alkalispirochaeta americana TaxID=159291 RepID=A0A1N6VLH4_9SPIO|nr:zinc ribbon domain-containing protein [Alkalispirochaeta americana]SIQ78712.1 putative regulatory protein, FmdB family [Alkalispirochaeta americana]
MPSYDYQCRSCGHTFETFQSMAADALVDCPSCEKPELRRIITGGAGVIFKGSGFYVNDSKAKGSGSASEGKAGKAAPAEAPKKSEQTRKAEKTAAT